MRALVCILAVLLTGVAAFGAVIQTSLTAPTDNVLAACDIADGARYQGIANTPGLFRSVGESFRNGTAGLAADSVVDRFTMKMVAGANAANIGGQEMMAAVVTVVDDNSAVYVSTVSDWTNVGTLPTGLSATAPTYVTFDIPNFTVTAGVQYAILVNFANTGATNYLGDGTQSNLGGFIESGSSIVGDSRDIIGVSTNLAAMTSEGDEMAFYLQTVPEPATMTLIGLGALGLIRRRK